MQAAVVLERAFGEGAVARELPPGVDQALLPRRDAGDRPDLVDHRVDGVEGAGVDD